MKKHLFNISKWTKLDKTLEQKYNVLLSLFSIVGASVSVVKIVVDAISSTYSIVVVDFVILTIMIITYILNERGQNSLAKFLFVGLLNTVLFVYANIVPKSIGIYFYFSSVIGITALIFDPKVRFTRNLFIALPIILVVLLEWSAYSFFGHINILESVEDLHSFPINLFISLILLAFSIYQMTLINQQIDQKRLIVTNELESKNEDLKKTNTELDHFVYRASHDLKSPLSSISGLINIAKHEVKEEKSIEYFDMIDGRIDKLNLFIKEIIDLTRNSRLESVKEEVDIALLVDNAIENNRYMENAGSIEFIINIEENGNYQLDRARLEVVLNNLISNAIKYHKKFGDRWIEISVKKLKKNVIFIIKDNGTGIAEEHLKKIFDMFYRGHASSDGSGLGLYIVKDVVKKMNGEITLTSKESEGTETIIKLPLD